MNFEKMEDEGGDSARVSGLNICLPNPTMMDRQQPRVSNSGKCVTSESRSHYDTVIEYVKYMLFCYYIALYAEYFNVSKVVKTCNHNCITVERAV